MLLIVGFACDISSDFFTIFCKQVADTAEGDRICRLAGKNQIILAGSRLFIELALDSAQSLYSICGIGNLVQAAEAINTGLDSGNTVCRISVSGSPGGLQCSSVG